MPAAVDGSFSLRLQKTSLTKLWDFVLWALSLGSLNQGSEVRPLWRVYCKCSSPETLFEKGTCYFQILYLRLPPPHIHTNGRMELRWGTPAVSYWASRRCMGMAHAITRGIGCRILKPPSSQEVMGMQRGACPWLWNKLAGQPGKYEPEGQVAGNGKNDGIQV